MTIDTASPTVRPKKKSLLRVVVVVVVIKSESFRRLVYFYCYCAAVFLWDDDDDDDDDIMTTVTIDAVLGCCFCCHLLRSKESLGRTICLAPVQCCHVQNIRAEN